ncbi:MAG: ribulose-5-phosphate 4-epimerase/fuculose-1-phosphate aldolase [Candidatus Azotimanducaceae bacterium]|jgi:ribulose-5-phosphate 4-epimerase/fuculose-1-phosphate aldolase
MSEAINQNFDVRAQVSAEEWQVRQDLAAAYRMVAHYGWDDMVFTHLSARVPGPEEHFLLNPFGYLFSEVTASNLVKVDLEGEIVLDSGHQINTAGFTIHSAVHMSRGDAHAVMHVHTDSGVAVASSAQGLLPLNQHAMFVYHDIAYHDWEGVALDLDERERLVADLGDHNLMILRNHGTLTLGGSIASCFLRLYYLERACKIQVQAATQGKLNMPSEQAIGMMEKTFNKPEAWEGFAATAWSALVRQADRLDPGYRS